MKKPLKRYRLYTWGPKGDIYSRSCDYVTGMWIVEVKAESIKQAYRLLGKEVYSEGRGSPGIVELDRAWAMSWSKWPWKNKSLMPKLWKGKVDA